MQKDSDQAVDVGVVIPAAGSGRRMGGVKKAWLELRGEPLLVHALRPFLDRADVGAVVVALRADDAADPPDWLLELDERVRVVAGGETRADSVARGLAVLPDELSIVAVHDAARPLLSADVLERCLVEARAGHGAVAGVPAFDTLKLVDDTGEVVRTADRTRFWHAQTPQVFPRSMLRDAFRRCGELAAMTDDASIVEAAGGRVVMVPSRSSNLKVTTPEDVRIAEALLPSTDLKE